MPKINPKKLKPAKMQDPPRYPKVINGYEGLAKAIGKKMIQKIVLDVSQQMIKTIKQ